MRLANAPPSSANHRRTGAARLLAAVLVLLVVGLTAAASADEITPSDRVTTRVIVRDAPAEDGERIAALERGERAALLDDEPYWYRIRLSDGREGWVAKAWTTVLREAPPVVDDDGLEIAAAPFRMHVIDVGTGLAIFLEGPDFALVYDAGSNDDVGLGEENRVIAYLEHIRPGLRRLDHIILSHAHTDHAFLLPDLFDAYEVGDVWDSGRLNDICGYREMLQRIEARPTIRYHTALAPRGVHVVRFGRKQCRRVWAPAITVSIPEAPLIEPGVPIRLGANASMVILYANGAGSGPSNVNRSSLVVRFDLGETRILVMGDAEAGGGRRPPHTSATSSSVEGRLLACCRSDLRADVLVVGHHGSETSSRESFLDAVDSRTFIVSAGPRPYSGHVLPDESVIDELDERGDIWRTDIGDEQCGASARKIGRDDDGPGGCDNIIVTVTQDAGFRVAYMRGVDE